MLGARGGFRKGGGSVTGAEKLRIRGQRNNRDAGRGGEQRRGDRSELFEKVSSSACQSSAGGMDKGGQNRGNNKERDAGKANKVNMLRRSGQAEGVRGRYWDRGVEERVKSPKTQDAKW